MGSCLITRQVDSMKTLNWSGAVSISSGTSYTCPSDGYCIIDCSHYFQSNTQNWTFEAKINNIRVCGSSGSSNWGCNATDCQIEVNQGCVISGSWTSAVFIPYK